MKTIDYFGYEVDVPDDTTHIAADSDGVVYAFVGEPGLGYEVWWPAFGFAGMSRCYTVDCPALDMRSVNWKESLKEIKP